MLAKSGRAPSPPRKQPMPNSYGADHKISIGGEAQGRLGSLRFYREISSVGERRKIGRQAAARRPASKKAARSNASKTAG
jgi:hypothetical protein